MLPRGQKYHSNVKSNTTNNRSFSAKRLPKPNIPTDEVESVNYFDTGNGDNSCGKKLVNMFPIELKPTTSIHQYHVQISPPIENRYLSNSILKQVMDPSIDFLQSGSILYLLKAIPSLEENQLKKSCSLNGVDYSVSIAYTKMISNCDKEFMTFVNIVLKSAQAKRNLTRIGRHCYDEKNATTLHGHSLRILGGTISTTLLTSKGLVLLVDMIHKSMRTESILTTIQEKREKFQKGAPGKISQALRNSIVYLTYRKKTVHIEDVDFGKNPLSTFTYHGKPISFAEYYKQQYGIDNIDPDQPLLKNTNRKTGNVEYYIPSLCLLTGTSEDMRNNYKTMSSVKRVTQKPPNERIRETIRHQLECNKDQNFADEINKWGISIVPKLIEVQTTTLEKSPIKMGDNIEITSDLVGMFKVENRKVFMECKPIEKILVLHQGDSVSKDIKHFCQILKDTCEVMGLNVSKMEFTFNSFSGPRLSDIISNIEKLSIVLMVIKFKNCKEYDILKEKTIANLGVPSQCVIEKNIAQSDKLTSIVRNIVIEMTSKLGGIPWITSIPMKKNTMIVGMDVHHSGEVYIRTKSSIVGFVSTYGSNACQYYSQIHVQKPGIELVKGMKSLIEKAIENFRNEQRKLPEHIIFYRDGVGSGQESSISNEEIMSIQQVCKKHSILLNFIIVLKRINNRIYHSLDSKEFGNLNPGTVLDGDLFSGDDNETSFFLQSHHVANSQGTATPVRYKIILSESLFSKSYYQNLTFKLCHLYYNRCGISSVPAPCMYAHRVAFLHGQSKISKEPHNNLTKTLYYL